MISLTQTNTSHSPSGTVVFLYSYKHLCMKNSFHIHDNLKNYIYQRELRNLNEDTSQHTLFITSLSFTKNEDPKIFFKSRISLRSHKLILLFNRNNGKRIANPI